MPSLLLHFCSQKQKLDRMSLRVSLRTHWMRRYLWWPLQALILVALTHTASRGDPLESQDNATASVSNPKLAQLSEREQAGLRGPVKSYVEESTYPPQPLANGKETPEIKRWEKTEYDIEGHVVVRRFRYADNSEWVTRYTFSPDGLLLKITSGKDTEPETETVYHYGSEGRLERITNSKTPDKPITFRYDENGRKTKLSIARPEDHVSTNGLGATSSSTEAAFDATGTAPNLPGGSSATTIYDAQDRPVEIQVRDAEGELVSKTVRTYDDRGKVIEEKQTMDDVTKMIPAETQNKMLARSDVSLNDLRDQLSKFLGGQGEIWSVAYSYDPQGRVSQTTRRMLNHAEYTVQSTYNDHGDVALEITRTTLAVSGEGKAPETHDSEAHYSYEYDDHGNWIEKKVSSRSSPDGAFTSSNEAARTLEYF